VVCPRFAFTTFTNQAAIMALFRVVNRCVGNLPLMPGMFPGYPARARMRSLDLSAGTRV
jgi:hypothetical protein